MRWHAALAAVLLAGCASNTPIGRGTDAGPGAMDAGDRGDAGTEDRDAAAGDAGTDAGPPRSCDTGCGVLERCVDGLCAPYPPCGGDGSCPTGQVCQRRMCLPEGEDLDGDGVGAPEDCVEGDPGIHPGADERCDGVDQDCDGTVDDGVAPRDCSTACGAGTEACVDGAFAGCTATMPVDETCNGADDDCDGSTDESLVRGCSTACGSGNETCSAGTWGGCTAPAPRAETCNGIDDDCDGTVDGMTRACSTACGAGVETCTAGSYGGCTAPPVPAETCNLADDDCDGVCDDVAGGCRHGVHRSYKSSTGEHFYSTSATEVACCGFTVEHLNAYYLYDAMAPGLVPFYRCLLSSGFHFYTRSSTCEGSPGATVEGIIGYLSASPACGSTPLYRLVRGNDHFFTTSTGERDTALAGGYASEGTAGHVWAAP
ncbi:MAG: putative metal-binding motif-containing protein [Myxococcales bacterium]|nr:putative metal-binding motif-containing protein [Myxococcales bacterium]